MSFVGNWDESVCFVGKEATKVLERLQDWAGTTVGGFSQLTRAIGGFWFADSCPKNEVIKDSRDVGGRF